MRIKIARVRKLFEACRFGFWSDISASRIQSHLWERRKTEAKFSAQTFNFYLQAVKQFCQWMVRDRRATESPVAHLTGLNVKTDRRHDRRALSVEELRRLLEAASSGDVRRGRKRNGRYTWYMTGPERAMLYRLAMETGLRSSELRSLTKTSFDLDAEPATVTVKAGYSKRRRQDVLPLRPELVRELEPFLADRDDSARVFDMPQKEKVAESIFRPDLEAARAAWISEEASAKEKAEREKSDFLAYVDREGRYADFHALRHSFITNVGRTGAPFKTAQDLARHSTPTLTARYTHGFKEDEVAAINGLPDLSVAPRKNAETD